MSKCMKSQDRLPLAEDVHTAAVLQDVVLLFVSQPGSLIKKFFNYNFTLCATLSNQMTD